MLAVIGEQVGHFRFKIRAMLLQAGADIQAVIALQPGAAHVGGRAVADTENSTRRRFQLGKPCYRKLIDRRVGLAGIDDLAAEVFVDVRQRAGAPV